MTTNPDTVVYTDPETGAGIGSRKYTRKGEIAQIWSMHGGSESRCPNPIRT